MTCRRLAGAAALALAVSSCSAPSTGSHRLAVEAPRWLLRGFDARLDISVTPALADRKPYLVVVANHKSLGRIGTAGGRAQFDVPASALVLGPNPISVKTGSERRDLVVRVVPLAYAAAPAALIVTAAAVASFRRRRSRLSG